MAKVNETAIQKLKRGILLVIIGSVILFLGAAAVSFYSVQIRNNLVSVYSAVSLLILIIGAAIDLMSTPNIYAGFKIMEHTDKGYILGMYGVLLQIIASVLLTLGFYFIIFNGASDLPLGFGFAIVGYTIGAACSTPIGLAFYRLGERYDVTKAKYRAAAYVLLPIIGPIILYFGLKKIR